LRQLAGKIAAVINRKLNDINQVVKSKCSTNFANRRNNGSGFSAIVHDSGKGVAIPRSTVPVATKVVKTLKAPAISTTHPMVLVAKLMANIAITARFIISNNVIANAAKTIVVNDGQRRMQRQVML